MIIFFFDLISVLAFNNHTKKNQNVYLSELKVQLCPICTKYRSLFMKANCKIGS